MRVSCVVTTSDCFIIESFLPRGLWTVSSLFAWWKMLMRVEGNDMQESDLRERNLNRNKQVVAGWSLWLCDIVLSWGCDGVVLLVAETLCFILCLAPFAMLSGYAWWRHGTTTHGVVVIVSSSWCCGADWWWRLSAKPLMTDARALDCWRRPRSN